ncbi:MAG: DUF4386 domain-containing protein [Candidatus Promineifilaceae bacterium]|nr:DUF4386 domain-containing protein [Candidatus Promineifilaceae bacterium]
MQNHEKRTARIVGALFLIAMAASLIGAGLIEPILAAPDLSGTGPANGNLVLSGVLLELLNGIAVIGIAVMMFPIFKKFNEALALGYVAFRIVEAVIIFAAVISPLALLALSQEFGSAGSADLPIIWSSFVTLRTILAAQLLGIFFGLGALLFYYLLYQSRLLPRFISLWGLIAVVLILSWNLLELIGISVSFGLFLALPIILNEIFLGIWLIVKGFNSAPVSVEPSAAALA